MAKRRRTIGEFWTIYALKDPSGQIRYIGKTGRTIAGRSREHINDALAGERTPRGAWIRELHERGERPRLRVLRRGQGPGWATVERDLIDLHRATGADLLNVVDGGPGVPGWQRSPAWRAAHRAACQRSNKALAARPEWLAAKRAGEVAWRLRRAATRPTLGRERTGSGGPRGEVTFFST